VVGLGPRFALEVAFLVALAIGVGVADLSAASIVVVMVVAWLLICLFELAVWAEGPRFPALERRKTVVEEDEPAAVTEIRAAETPRRKRFWRRRREVTEEGA
jgi:hypothetical protein